MKFDSDSDAWELEDAEERERQAPDWYPIPAIAERTSRQLGDRVELLFFFRGRDQHGPFTQSERLPVTIREVSRTGYAGTPDAGPACSTLLRVGDSVSFEARHIASILAAASGNNE